MAKIKETDLELSETKLNEAFSVCTIAWAIQDIGFKGLKQRLGELLRRKGVTGKNPITRANLAKLVLKGMDLARELIEDELAEAEEEAKKKKGKPE